MRVGAYLVFALTIAACSTPRSVEQTTPLTTPEPAAPDPAIVEVNEQLDAFLAARWTYDQAKARRFLSAEDQEHMAAAFHPKVVPSNDPMTSVRWTILTTKVDGDAATAEVEVIRPPHPKYFWLGGLALDKLQLLPADEVEGFAPSLHVDRVVEKLTYQLRRDEEGWRVVMNWAARQRLHENMHNTREQQLALHEAMDAFNGSEAEFVRQRGMFSAPDDPAAYELFQRVEAAERCVRARDFECAKDRYEPLVNTAGAPRWLVDRYASLDELAERHRQRVERAALTLTASEDGDDLVVRVQSPGDVAAVDVVVRATQYGDTAHISRRISRFDSTGLGEARLRMNDVSDRTPPYVGAIEFTRSSGIEDLDVAPLAFRRKRENLATDGDARRLGIRVLQDVRPRLDEFAACPDLPTTYLDIRVDVGARGTRPNFTPLDTESAALADCVAKVGALFPLADSEHTGAVLRFYPSL